MKPRELSKTLSSNWFKRYKIPYLFLLADSIILIVISFFIVKDLASGLLLNYFPKINPILITLILLIIIIFRFNISLLMFSKQRAGLYLSMFYVFLVLFFEMQFLNINTSPMHYIGNTLIKFFEKFFFRLPNSVDKIFEIFMSVYIYYLPLIFYTILLLMRVKLNTKARYFDILTGFYVTSLSDKLKITDIISFSLQLLIAMFIGLLSSNFLWTFLVIPLMIYSAHFLFKKIEMTFPVKKRTKYISLALFLLLPTFVVYGQMQPYLGIISLMLSFVLSLVWLTILSKNWMKSLIVAFFSFFLIPLFSLGYNPFIYSEYGIVSKCIPNEGEKVFFVIKDCKGNLGIRVRTSRIVKPKYKAVKYLGNHTVEFTDHKDNKYYIKDSVFTY